MDILLYEFENGRATLTLNRPEKRNALDPDLIQALTAGIKRAEADKAKVLLLQANGPAFCAGADLAHMQRLQTFTPEENLADSRALKDMLYTLWSSPCVVVAKVHGPAIAGGCGLVSVCDFVYASEKAIFGYPETRIGFLPAIVAIFGIAKFGTAKVGPFLLHGKPFKTEQAHHLGMVHHIYPEHELDAAVNLFCEDIETGCSTQSLAATKKLLRMAGDEGMEAKLEKACALNVATRQTEDFRRGIAAVLNKEKLSW